MYVKNGRRGLVGARHGPHRGRVGSQIGAAGVVAGVALGGGACPKIWMTTPRSLADIGEHA